MNTSLIDKNKIQIAGAGPAGLVAAIKLAQSGRQVAVYESKPHVGARFNGDHQGLENWSTEQDVIEWMEGEGITTQFTKQAFSNGTAFDASGESYPIKSQRELFYLVERGPAPQSFDSALLKQAESLGVEIIFGHKLKLMQGKGILATGPKAADAIAVGYHFETTMANGFWVILDDQKAPQGYSYLLTMNGKGTLKTCMFSDFKNEKIYLERTVKEFERLLDLKMENPVFHGGAGNFRIPSSAVSGGHPIIGEQAGYQDFLWGFGMRYAIASGLLAAESLLENKNYELLWRQYLNKNIQASMVNRVVYAKLGNRGYRWMLRRSLKRQWDPYQKLHDLYQPNWLKSLLLPWAKYQFNSKRQDISCQHLDCHCIWCRHGDH